MDGQDDKASSSTVKVVSTAMAAQTRGISVVKQSLVKQRA